MTEDLRQSRHTVAVVKKPSCKKQPPPPLRAGGLQVRLVTHLPRNLHPDNETFIICTRTNKVARYGRIVQLDRVSRIMLVALAAHEGRIYTNEELADFCFGDDPRGGPDHAYNRLGIGIGDLRYAGAMMGFIVTRIVRGVSLRNAPVGEQAQARQAAAA